MRRKLPPLCVTVVLAAVLLTACQRTTGFDESLQPVALAADTRCVLTGLRLIDFAGPKAQIHFAGESPRFFADTVKMFHVLRAEQATHAVRGAFVQDMSGADWFAPDGRWIDARTAFYVQGAALIGPLGPTLAAFASREAAETFAAEHGGSLLRFADVDAETVILDGGALHDTSM